MSDGNTQEELRAALSEVLDQRRNIDESRHHKHHEFMDKLIARERRREEFCEALKKTVGGWAVIVFLTGLGTAVWHYVVTYMNRGPH